MTEPVADDPTVPPEQAPSVPSGLREPVDPTFEAPGEPERERVVAPTRRRRRAARAGTNPSAEDLPDVVPPRDPPAVDEDGHARWLREQRPPHWE